MGAKLGQKVGYGTKVLLSTNMTKMLILKEFSIIHSKKLQIFLLSGFLKFGLDENFLRIQFSAIFTYD